MAQRFRYGKLEIKRAILRLPQLGAGVLILSLMLGLAALFAGDRLYGEALMGRMTIGVVLPEEEGAERLLTQMLSHMESVESICDFQYMDQEEAGEALEAGEIYAAMYIPSGLIQGIMNGTNPPIQIRTAGEGLENRIFVELTQAGARTLGSAQAGIYAGDQLLIDDGMEERIGQFQQELNQIYIDYSLRRESLFWNRQVSATGDLEPVPYYAGSALTVGLLFLAIPVSSYLRPESMIMARKLKLLGIGPFWAAACRLAGLWLLLIIGALPLFLLGGWAEIFALTPYAAGSLVFLCLGAASMALFAFEAAGNGMGGILLLFLGTVILHFLSGGILPAVFLPQAVREISPFLPNRILIGCAGLLAEGSGEIFQWIPAAGLAMLFYLLTVGVRRR